MNITLYGVKTDMPDPEKIPVPKTAAALKLAVDTLTQRKAVRAERDEADAAVILARGEGDPKGVEVAEAALRAAQGRLDDIIEAERHALDLVRETVAAEADAWAKIARADADKAIAKLATAARMAAAARDDLADSLGVLRMLSRGVLVREPKPGGYHDDLEPAVAGLTDAVGRATEELRDLS